MPHFFLFILYLRCLTSLSLCFFAMCNSFLLACRWSAPVCGPLSCASLYEKLPYLRWWFFWCFMFKKRKKAWREEEAKQRKISNRKKNITQNKYKMKRWKIIHSVFLYFTWMDYVCVVVVAQRISLHPCSTFISLSHERERSECCCDIIKRKN